MVKSLILLFLMGMHPVHVAFISMDYSAESKGFKTFVKFYSDDFLLDYNLLFNDNETIDFSQNNKIVRKKINDYLNEKIELYVGEQKIEGEVLDYESVDGEIKINILYPTGKDPKTVKMKCQIMTDIHSDQSNFIIFRYKDNEEGVKLTSDNKEQTFTLSQER